ncbi:hypothetical protein [Bacillus wiedmannii]|uniref:hypothetical protein n=1 Tax=Bacillus wiedmannii TaxID=1890302 RepID=UPI000BFD5CEA|nr:hypothetical protein [Bacillus wiedmannii]PHB37064.1 hypothetical protein COE82_24120 [Bacillus wiedmannii]PHC25454.1 hypothetical protein COF00_13130 [Bacillus wiedmannii]
MLKQLFGKLWDKILKMLNNEAVQKLLWELLMKIIEVTRDNWDKKKKEEKMKNQSQNEQAFN